MPPALSDEEVSQSSGEEEIPARKQKASKSAEPIEEVEEEDEDEDEDEDEEEYVVEEITSHKIQKGTVLYRVKWQGYDDPRDMTWEGEDNLEGVEALEDYHKSIGGKPDTSKKRKGRKSGVDTETSTPPVAAKRMKKEKEWAPPPGSWEDEVDHVDTVEQRLNPKTGKIEKFGYLVWKHHVKTQHPLPLIFKKCPQRMLAYFEEHLVFNNAEEEEEETNGHVNMTGVDDDI